MLDEQQLEILAAEVRYTITDDGTWKRAMVPNTTEPFDRDIIKTLRAKADAHAHEPYAQVTTFINWAWFNRMVATFEKSLDN